MAIKLGCIGSFMRCYWVIDELLLGHWWGVTGSFMKYYCVIHEMLVVTGSLMRCDWLIDEVLLCHWWGVVTGLLMRCDWFIHEVHYYWVIDDVLVVTGSLMSCYWVIDEVLLSYWWGVTKSLMRCYWCFFLSATVPVDLTPTLNTPHSPTQATRSVSAPMCCVPVCLIAYRHGRHLWNSVKSIFHLPSHNNNNNKNGGKIRNRNHLHRFADCTLNHTHG